MEHYRSTAKLVFAADLNLFLVKISSTAFEIVDVVALKASAFYDLVQC